MAPGDPQKYKQELLTRLEQENPYLVNWLKETEKKAVAVGDDEYIDIAIHFSLVVYRMIEIESNGNMPVVSPEIARPLQVEAKEDIQALAARLMNKLSQENQEVIKCGLALNREIWKSKDRRLMVSAFLTGMCLYALLDSQQQADEMKKSFG